VVRGVFSPTGGGNHRVVRGVFSPIGGVRRSRRGVKDATNFVKSCSNSPPTGGEGHEVAWGVFSPIGGGNHVVVRGVKERTPFFRTPLPPFRGTPPGGRICSQALCGELCLKKIGAALEAARAAACPPSPLRWGAGRAILPGCACRHVFSVLYLVYFGTRYS
jgi:hypothetical protein